MERRYQEIRFTKQVSRNSEPNNGARYEMSNGQKKTEEEEDKLNTTS